MQHNSINVTTETLKLFINLFRSQKPLDIILDVKIPLIVICIMNKIFTHNVLYRIYIIK
jgi:hypothetical protein